MSDERVERRSEPVRIRVAQGNERPASSLDIERGLPIEQYHPRSGDSRGSCPRAPRPRNRSAVRLRRIGGREHEHLTLLVLQVLRSQLAQALDCARQRELRSSQALHEVPAATDTERLERTQLRVHRAVATADALSSDAVARDDSLPLEQELGQRAAIRLAGEEGRRQRPPALRGRRDGRAGAGEPSGAPLGMRRVVPPGCAQRRPGVVGDLACPDEIPDGGKSFGGLELARNE